MATPVRVFRIPGAPTDPNLPKLRSAGFADDFERPDSATSLGLTPDGKAWTAVRGTWGIASGSAVMTVQDGSQIGIATVDALTPDGTLTCRLGSATSSSSGLAFRVADLANHLFINAAPGVYRLWKRIGGTASAIADAPAGSGVATPGLELSVTLAGTTVLVYRAGVLLITATVPDLATVTSHGLLGATTTSRFDQAAFTA